MSDCAVSVRQVDGMPSHLNVQVNGCMTIGSIREVYEVLLDAFNRGTQVSLDLEGVSAVDLSGLQIVCAAHRTAVQAGRGFSVAGNRRDVIVKAAGAAGFLRRVGCVKDIETCFWAGGAD